MTCSMHIIIAASNRLVRNTNHHYLSLEKTPDRQPIITQRTSTLQQKPLTERGWLIMCPTGQSAQWTNSSSAPDAKIGVGWWLSARSPQKAQVASGPLISWCWGIEARVRVQVFGCTAATSIGHQQSLHPVDCLHALSLVNHSGALTNECQSAARGLVTKAN